MKARAAVVRERGGSFLVEDVELADDLRPHEVLVNIVATGLCHTDLAVRDQDIPVPLPVVLGHEGAGIVARTGSAVTRVAAGDRVVLAPASCRRCPRCLAGHPTCCDNMLALNVGRPRDDGSHAVHDTRGHGLGAFFFGQSSFSTLALASESSVVKVPDDIPLETLGPLGCGLQTGAGTVINVLRPRPGDAIAIFGVGPVGLAALMAARASGCTTIVAVDVHAQRLELARGLGATHTINSRRDHPAEAIAALAPRNGLSFAVDTTGRADVIHQALASLAPMGRCALVGVSSMPRLELDYRVFSAGRSVQFVVEGDSRPEEFIPRLIDLHRAGLFPFERLLSFYDLADINEAIADTDSGAAVKAVIRMPL